MTLDKTTIDACLTQLRTHWPELSTLPQGVGTLVLNRIQQVLEKEGLEAITPERINGWRKIAEEYLVPFHEASGIAEALQKESPPPPAPDPSENPVVKACYEALQNAWPEFTSLPDIEAQRAFLWAFCVVQDEGAAAITPARIKSWQESLQRGENGRDGEQE
jgi:hypothetical protein